MVRAGRFSKMEKCRYTLFLSRFAIVSWVTSIGSVCYLSLVPKIEFPMDFRRADLVYHSVAYFWLSLLPFFGFASSKKALAYACLMFPLGLALEFAQFFLPGRLFSVFDIGANGLGVLFGTICGRYVGANFSWSFNVKNQ